MPEPYGGSRSMQQSFLQRRSERTAILVFTKKYFMNTFGAAAVGAPFFAS